MGVRRSRSMLPIYLLIGVLLIGMLWYATRLGARGPERQSAVCERAYAGARTAADSAAVDLTPIGNPRTPGVWTCGDERRYLGARK